MSPRDKTSQQMTSRLDTLGRLHQIEIDLRVVWLALGNPENTNAYLAEIGETVNSLANRLRDVSRQMEGSAR